MIRKALLATSLLLPLIAISGAAYAGPQWNPTILPWKTLSPQTQSGSSVSKPYAAYVPPKKTGAWTFVGSPTRSARFVGQ